MRSDKPSFTRQLFSCNKQNQYILHTILLFHKLFFLWIAFHSKAYFLCKFLKCKWLRRCFYNRRNSPAAVFVQCTVIRWQRPSFCDRKWLCAVGWRRQKHDQSWLFNIWPWSCACVCLCVCMCGWVSGWWAGYDVCLNQYIFCSVIL